MRIGILTYGCAVNKSDSELMATLLVEAGYEVVLDSDEPDILVVNTCIVKGPTENKIIRKLSDLQAAGKKVIIAGCMSKAYPHMTKKFPGFAVIGVNNLDIVEVVRDYLACGQANKVLDPKEKVMPKRIRFNQAIDIVTISSGCLGNCAYCATKSARGSLKSYSPDALLDEISKSVKEGAKEVWLTSQDNGCYGLDIGTNLVELLEKIVKIPGDFKIRVGMMNPTHILRFLDELIEIYKSDKIFKFVHIPVQSGSDEVLKEMKRGYSTRDFEYIVSRFRGEMDVTISTDIIVGFPTETDKQFKETLEFLKRANPDFLNLSKYWPRKNTPAGEMKQLPRNVVSERSKKVAELYSKTLRKKNKSWLKKECSVTFTEQKGIYSVGRNLLYRPVLVEGNDLLGKTCSVKIIGTRKSELIGRLAKGYR